MPILKPGTPPADFPTYVFSKDGRLLHNSNITRMPQNQKEWNSFIQELDKLIKNETGAFVPTFTGFSTDPANATVTWARYGQIITMHFIFTTGTSDADSFTISNLPTNITPFISQTYPITGLVDNGSSLSSVGAINIASNGVLNFSVLHSASGSPPGAGGWTASAAKGIGNITAVHSVIYHLHHPEKL